MGDATLILKDGTQMFYAVFGPSIKEPNVPTMIFSHGGPGFLDGRSYYEFWQQFTSLSAGEIRVVFPDQRGSGRSADPVNSATLNVSQHAQDVRDLCYQLGIEKPIVAGVSQGGYISIAYAAMFPEQTGGLIICNSEAKRDSKIRVEAYKRNLPLFFGVDEQKAAFLSKDIERLDQDWDSQEYGEKFGSYYSRKGEEFVIIDHPETLQKFMGQEFGELDLEPQLPAITCPVLYLVGQYDCVHPAKCAERTRDLMTSVGSMEFHIIENSADPVYVDQWELSTRFVESFLEHVVPSCIDGK